ncbi:LppX_LprAFG lipoprotein [Streptomyces sp. NBC_01288]|uniref:LppX_LprAFG lipoprotein n=1 Tax=Streptomyces sp. NBC_01288 TaxID=2903814 RepID=UPI002E0D5B45|nr:LppX_LprAFG lipoprotein [Streptomyces sp. NBC_01288]
MSVLVSVPRRVTSAAFVAVLLAGGSVACGGGAKSNSAAADPPAVTPAAAVAKAGKNARGITSLHYRISGTVPGKDHLEAEASMSTQPLAMSMKMTATAAQGGNGRLEIRFVDKVMYLGGSAVRPEKLKGKSWLWAAPAVWGRGGVDNQSYGILPSQLQASPVAQSTLLTGSKDLRLIGTETVDGAKTTHYKGTVNSKDLTEGSLDQFIQLEVSDPLTMDLWTDGDGRTKQFRMRAQHNDDMVGTGDGPLDLTVTFLDINQPVTIKAPPAKDTTPLSAEAPKA